jgi:hypothetical protein
VNEVLQFCKNRKTLLSTKEVKRKNLQKTRATTEQQQQLFAQKQQQQHGGLGAV